MRNFKTLKLENMPQFQVEKIKTIARRQGVTGARYVVQSLKKIQPINEHKSCQPCDGIYIKNFPSELLGKLQKNADYFGVSLATYTKIHLVLIADSEPEYLKQEFKD